MKIENKEKKKKTVAKHILRFNLFFFSSKKNSFILYICSAPNDEKLYNFHGGLRHLSIILVKDFHLFKISELVFSFYLKLHNFKQVGVFY